MKNKALILICLISFSSCVHMGRFSVLSDAECRIGKIEGQREFADIYFTFYNNSEKAITSILFNCLIFDSEDDSNPFVGNNAVEAHCSQYIPAFSSQEIVYNLDSYINEMPESPYVIDFFYIQRIEYDDGSVWEDPYVAFM
ncbi:MAG: hypothetical protein R3Y36_08005 [Spirochaetales bacterium]